VNANRSEQNLGAFYQEAPSFERDGHHSFRKFTLSLAQIGTLPLRAQITYKLETKYQQWRCTLRLSKLPAIGITVSGFLY